MTYCEARKSKSQGRHFFWIFPTNSLQLLRGSELHFMKEKCAKISAKIRKMAKVFEIHETHLKRELKTNISTNEIKSESFGKAPAFPPAQEKVIIDHVLKLTNLFFFSYRFHITKINGV